MQQEISRIELLRTLKRAGLGVSPHQLLRWHDAGLLPQPRRVGRGRGRGTVSMYPARAVVQALWLGTFLKQERRDLDEAGWYMWVFGFPVTNVARDLLIYELETEEKTLRHEYQRFKRGVRGTAFELVGSSRRVPGLERMRTVVKGDAMTRVFRMLTELKLGLLHEQTDYSEEDWEDLQAAVLTELQPVFSYLAHDEADSDIVTDPSLPPAEKVAAGLRKQSVEIGLPQVIKALKAVSDPWLCVIRNEAQAFSDHLRAGLHEPPALMSRPVFLDYFQGFYVVPDADRVREFRRGMGWSRPPLSPLAHLQQQYAASNPSHAAPVQEAANSPSKPPKRQA